MQPIIDAAKALLLQAAQWALSAVVPVVIAWFKQHVLGKDKQMQALAPAALRATARQWVNDFLSEIGNALVAKLPANIQPFVNLFLPPLETTLAQAIDAGLDASGL